MESYIVRVYHRGGRDPGKLVGVVEKVGVEGRLPFTTPDELWQLMTSRKRRERSTARNSARRAQDSAGAPSGGKNRSGSRAD